MIPDPSLSRISMDRTRVRILLVAVATFAFALANVGCINTAVAPSLQAGLAENPGEGVAVKIVEIDDQRVFGDFDGTRLDPTLTDAANTEVGRARAIARGRLANGAPGANLLLEEPLTVAGTIRDALARGLREAGFRVVESGTPEFETAIPLNVALEKYWMMRSPPSASPYVLGEIRARVTGPLPGLDVGAEIDVRERVVRGGFSRAMWRQTLDLALTSFTKTAAEEFTRVRVALEQTPASQLAPSGLAMLPNLKTAPSKKVEHQIDFGKFYLLAIGIDDYKALPRLKTAVSDARAVSTLLGTAYGFETEVLVNATRQDLIRAFSRYRSKVGPRDNLLIYFAGHGWRDEEADLGYWLPVDADPDDETNWVSNAKITSILRAMQAKHVMVVSDSCYSGTLTRGIQLNRKGPTHFERLAARRTRLALTSGGIEPVVDSGGGEHSVFANAFLRALSDNEAVLDATTLHSRIRQPIMRDAEQTPQFGPIRKARHEDGDFLFVRTDER